jgi:YggT family protein
MTLAALDASIGGPIGGLLRAVITLYIIAIFGVILLSWFPHPSGGVGASVFEALRKVTDPVLVPLRRVIPPIGGTIDLTPMIVVFVLYVVRGAV